MISQGAVYLMQCCISCFMRSAWGGSGGWGGHFAGVLKQTLRKVDRCAFIAARLHLWSAG